MPDSNSSLPPISQSSQENKSMPPQGVMTPQAQTVSADLSGAENQVLGAGGPTRASSRLPRLPFLRILMIIIPVLVIAVSYYVYFVYLPNSQASNYISQTWGDFQKLKEQVSLLKSNESAYEDMSTSIEVSKGAFFDVAESKIYTEAVVDAKADLEKIKNTQFAIAEARRGAEKYRAGGDIKDLDEQLDSYLTKMEEGINRLQLYGDFRVDMLDAVGEEYNQELAKVLDINNPSMPREEKVLYLEKLQKLNKESLDRLGNLASVPDDILDHYNITVSNHRDMDAVIGLMISKFAEGTAEGDRAAVLAFAEFAQRQMDRAAEIKKAHAKVAKESDTAKTFADAVSKEEKLLKAFLVVRERYGQLETQ